MFVGRLPCERAVRHLVRGHALGLDLLARLAERQRLGLREEVGHQQVLVVADLVVGVHEPDEVARDELRALVDAAGRTRAGRWCRAVPHTIGPVCIVDRVAVEVDRLAVALHVELLEVGGEAREVLAVRQDRLRLAPKKSSYQMPIRPSSTGRFRSNGAVRKCSSIAWKPASISPNCSGPIAIISDRPIAESYE